MWNLHKATCWSETFKMFEEVENAGSEKGSDWVVDSVVDHTVYIYFKG